MAIRAVLFDLDGTLLDIDLHTFLERYFEGLAGAISDALPGASALDAVMSATRAITRSHPGETNAEVYQRTLAGVLGCEYAEVASAIERFFAEVHPTLRATSQPFPGTAAAVECVLGLGLRAAVATHPIFPQAAIHQRVSWAGLDHTAFDLVTVAENSKAAKPSADYYLSVARALDVKPSECIMVGDDRSLDLPAGDVGMTTFYVGDSPDAVTHFKGDLLDFADLLPRLAGEEQSLPA